MVVLQAVRVSKVRRAHKVLKVLQALKGYRVQ